jgi:peptidoglycan/LPS O-acetylase OafA/YrhL
MVIGASTASRSGPRLKPLDGLRACAALSVLGYHVSETTGHTEHNLAATELKAGVAIFFVISGLVLYVPHARAIRSGTRAPPVRSFIRRRVIRILPAYWTALTAWLAINLLTMPAGGLFGRSSVWWSYYGLASSYSSHTYDGGLPVAWTLCVEFAFYLVLPGLAYALRCLAQNGRLRTQRSAAAVQLTAITLLALCSLYLRLTLTASPLDRVDDSHRVLAMSLPMLFDWFALGMGLAVLAAEWEHGRERFLLLGRLADRTGVCWLGAGVLFGIAMPIQGGDLQLPLDTAAAHLAIGLGCALLALPVIAPAAASGQSRLLAVMGSPLMAWLGTISYGIYLLHVPAMWEIRALVLGAPVYPRHIAAVGVAPAIGLLALTIVVAVGLGAASWYLVERPALRRFGAAARGRRLATAGEEPTVAAETALATTSAQL